MLSPLDLERFILEHQLDASLLRPESPTPTVEAAANAVGTKPEQIVKTLVFTVEDQTVLVIACGTEPVDHREIAAHFGVGHRRVKLADAQLVAASTGFPVGAVPPFGHSTELPVLLDSEVLVQPEVFAGGGDAATLVRTTPQEIQRVTGATVLRLRS